ncbi:30S ribosomal protein S21 [Candidatus Wolfebacteria bacterium CG10_big_fil_rev_8_21_14_0_10_31_9]|uniref:30S ribosomal protein S21 n=1 Tax=Candidatus Wolfebacteria bacterium CG10_big_fil_rev_8_21_14_0_10_31_9 TaxID=1975070 RepID=A0A2H0RCP0_9BACT|nr:MAG: 30S ribosomal protein S21 [Candidatus Wolfebacteria bacterium CG10_big_fil_rev_8_21_14_0_10_31_9]
MAIEVKRKEGESASAFLYRFTKKMQQSGVLKESKKRRHAKRAVNKNKRRKMALYREDKKIETEKKKKLGLM